MREKLSRLLLIPLGILLAGIIFLIDCAEIVAQNAHEHVRGEIREVMNEAFELVQDVIVGRVDPRDVIGVVLDGTPYDGPGMVL